MTVKVRWLAPRPTQRRVLRPKDFQSLGIPHQEETTWEAGNHFTVSMDDAAGDLLASALPKEFVVLQAPEAPAVAEVEKSDDSLDDSGQGEPDGSSSESEGEEMTTGDESPVKTRRPR